MPADIPLPRSLTADVLVFPADGEEARAVAQVLRDEGFPVGTCEDAAAFADMIQAGCNLGVFVVDTAEAALATLLDTVILHLRRSDSLLVVLCDHSTCEGPEVESLRGRDDVVLLPWPAVGRAGLVGTVHFALKVCMQRGKLAERLDVTDEKLQQCDSESLALRRDNRELERRVQERTRECEHRADMLRTMASQLTRAEQLERRRLARVLHDDLQQLLVAGRLKLKIMQLQCTCESTRASVPEIDEIFQQSIEAARTLSVELSPPVLHDGSFFDVLRWLARRVEQQHGLKLRIDRPGDEQFDLEDDETKALLFESVRELVFNVVKHGNVDEAVVTLSYPGVHEVQVEVSDDGAGFDAEVARDPASLDNGFGLFSMRERIEANGGSMTIDSAPSRGTRITLRLPRLTDENSPECICGDCDKQAISLDSPIRVLLVDDHEMLREGLASILDQCPDITMVGEAANGQEAIEMVRQRQPDVVVMDVSMPGMGGVQATRRILRASPDAKVVCLSTYRREDMEMAMREAGAIAYLPKEDSAEALVETIRNCADGRASL